jgi:alpha-beta hydrolase superfamily lysophospholipase
MLSLRFYDVLSHRHSQLKWLYQAISYRFHQLKQSGLGKLRDLKSAASRYSEEVSYTVDGLKIVGDFYPAQTGQAIGTIILLHGSSIFGRKLSLIQALGKEFQAIGYAVLAIDLRGYGQSDDPQDYTPEAFDFAADVQGAIAFLETFAPQYAKTIYVVGHSFGGAVALAAPGKDNRVQKIVSFGPPRRLTERFLGPEAREKKKLLVRWQADMQLNQPLTMSLWEKVLEPLNIENYTKAFSAPGHTPLLLIDAEQEPEADMEFLRQFSKHLQPPSAYWTVPNTDHYLGAGLLLNRPMYNPQTIQPFVQNVDHWLRTGRLM